MLAYFNYDWAGKYSIEQMEAGAGIDTQMEDIAREDAVCTACKLENFDDFLKDTYNIDCTAERDIDSRKTKLRRTKEINEELRKGFNENDYFVFAGYSWDLYTTDASLLVDGGGGHYMMIVGFTDEGWPIVSSWGRKYILDAKTSDHGRYRHSTINF